MQYVVSDESFLLSNVRLPDEPVVYCSNGLTQLTGWSRHDLLRRSSTCTVMHGPLTDDDDVARLRHALQSDTATEPFEIVLYTSNGQFLPRDAMHKRGLCRHAVSVCLTVCRVRTSSRNE